MLSFWLSAALAAEVLIPSATPLTPDDFAVAESFYRQVVAASLQAGLAVEDADGIRVWAGADAENCFDTESCPGSLWGRTDARVALVMRVGKGTSGTLVEVRLFAPDDPTPLKVMRETVQPGKEASFSAKLALTTQEVLSITPERTAPKPPDNPQTVVTPEAPRIVIQPLNNPDTPPQNPPDPQDPPPDAPLVVPQPPPPLTNRHHLPKVVFNAMVASGMSEAAWFQQQHVRSGRFSLQVGAGLATGDVDLGYSANMLVKRESLGGSYSTLGQDTWFGWGYGNSFQGWVAISYTPIWFLDISLSGGFFMGNQYLSLYRKCVSNCPEEEKSFDYDPHPTVQGTLEPKVRLLPLATGSVKPYLLVGATLRVYPGPLLTEESEEGESSGSVEGVAYPSVLTGVTVSPTFGGGMYIDVLRDVSFFVEVPFTPFFPGSGYSDTSYISGETRTVPTASQLPHWGGLLRASLGVDVRL